VPRALPEVLVLVNVLPAPVVLPATAQRNPRACQWTRQVRWSRTWGRCDWSPSPLPNLCLSRIASPRVPRWVRCPLSNQEHHRTLGSRSTRRHSRACSNSSRLEHACLLVHHLDMLIRVAADHTINRPLVVPTIMVVHTLTMSVYPTSYWNLSLIA
jgi:hypothetical protein